jgi:hypothetical protein
LALEGCNDRIRVAALDVIGFYIERATIPIRARWDDAEEHLSLVRRVVNYGPGPVAAPCMESMASTTLSVDFARVRRRLACTRTEGAVRDGCCARSSSTC